MTWLRIDDNFHQNPKVMDAGAEAVGLYVLGLSFCANQLTDGHLSRKQVRVLAAIADAELDLADRLVEVGLWEPTDEGWRVPDYLDYNPSRADVEAQREKNRQRQQRHRGQRDNASRHAVTGPVTNGGRASTPSRPVPSPNSSSSTEVIQQDTAEPVDDEGEEGGWSLEAVWSALADRRQPRAKITSSADGWRRSVITNAADEHTERAVSLHRERPGLTPAEIAAVIDGDSSALRVVPRDCDECGGQSMVETPDGCVPCPSCRTEAA